MVCSEWNESLNSKQRSFHLFKRGSGELFFYGEIMLKVDQDESREPSQLISSFPCLAARRGKEELMREKENT